MAGPTKTLEIDFVNGSIAVTHFEGGVAILPTEYFPVCGIKSIKGIKAIGHGTRDAQLQRKNPYPFTDMLQVSVDIESKDNKLLFDIQSVTNQPTWTADTAGLTNAVNSFRDWAAECCGSDDVVVELDEVNANLINILNAIVASDQDIEVLLVRDTGNSNVVVQQIIDYVEGVPTYSYKDVDGNPYVPVGPLVYLDPSAVLNLILAQITSINNQFTGSVTSVTKVNISGNAAYAIPAGYHAWQLIVTAGTVTDGTVVYPVGTYGESAPLKMTLPAGTTLNATGATAYLKLLTI